ncbi:MAG: cache domain-containing protein [Rhizomicrobium sp.]
MNPALFNAAKSSMKFSVSGQVISSVTHGPIIVALLPLQDAHGAFNGAIAMGVNAKWLDYILKARNLPRGAVVSVFDRKGQIMATNNETVARTLFSTMPASQTLLGGLETRNDAKGEPWTFSAAPLSGNNIFVGFGMRESHLFGPTYLHVVADLLLPIAMIALAWGAIWFANGTPNHAVDSIFAARCRGISRGSLPAQTPA